LQDIKIFVITFCKKLKKCSYMQYRKMPIFRTPFWLCDVFTLSKNFLQTLFTSHKTCMKVST